MSELQLHAYSAVTAQQLSEHLSLAPLELHDNPRFAGVRVTTPLSSELARQRIQDAQNAVKDRDELLRRFEGVKLQHEGLTERARIRRARSSALAVWLALAQELARQEPAAQDVPALVESAQRAMKKDFVPLMGGMPPPLNQ